LHIAEAKQHNIDFFIASFNGDYSFEEIEYLNKYSEKLEELIMGADFMTDEEKENLFINKITYSIKSDAINEAFTCGNGDVEGLIGDTNPVLMLKETR
jgi:hypothetical protein